MADLYNLLDELEEQQQQPTVTEEEQQLNDENGDDDPAAAAASRRLHDNDSNDDRDRLDLPPALAEAARFQKSKTATNANTNNTSTPATVRMSFETQTTANTSSSTRYHQENDGAADVLFGNNNNEPLSLEDLMRDDYDGAGNNPDGGGLYSKLDHWWVQELHSPELLPYNDAIVDAMLHSLEMAEQKDNPTSSSCSSCCSTADNGNMKAMLSSIFQIDKERVQFVLSHLIKTRLQKIQQQAWFIAREQTDRLSQREVRFFYFGKSKELNVHCILFWGGEKLTVAAACWNLLYLLNKKFIRSCCCLLRLFFFACFFLQLLFLQEYGLLLEGHLQQTVTNHFPQEAWKALDEPHMISPPADWLEGYVFCHVKESCTIDIGTTTSSFSQFSQDDNDDDEEQQQALQYHQAGDCIIVRYHKIRHLLEEDKVELLM